MDNLTSIRLELGINAQKMIQHVQLHNEAIETQVEKGIQLALDELITNDNFVIMIKNETIKSLSDIVSKQVFSWELRNKISKMIEDKIAKKAEEYTDKIAEQITKSLNIQ
jgi:methionine aminopeptidase